MNLIRSTRGARSIVLASLLAVLVLATAASTADAHRLSVSRAKGAVTGFVKAIFYSDSVQNGDPAPTDYAVGQCRRRSAHSVSCVWIIDFADGSYCGAVELVSFRSAKSRRIRLRGLSDVACFDANDNQISKRAL